MSGCAPKTRPHVLAVVLLLTALILVGPLLAACSDQPESAVDPTEVFVSAVAAMQEVPSFTFTYDVVAPDGSEPVKGTVITRITGAVTIEGKMKATIDLLNQGIPLQIEFIADGDTHYIKDPTSQKWQAIPANLSPVGRLDLSAGTIQILEQIGDPQHVGTEDIDGVQVYHMSGAVAAADVAGIAGAATTDEPFVGDIWIGADDHLVRRIELEGAATDSEDPETLRVIELTGFGEPVTIEAPQ
jgi:hypothetical protein